MSQVAIGIDLGGTNLRAAVFAGLPNSSEAILVHREEVGSARSPEAITQRIGVLIPKLLQRAELGGLCIPIGIGFAGMLIGHDGCVASSPSFGWRDVPLGDLLRGRLGERYKIGIYNDVNAITYGESRLGAGVGASDILAVFVGTGIGAGAMCDGILLQGSNNTAAELGHTKVAIDDDALQCDCGLKGCVEAYVGGSSLQERARRDLDAWASSAAVQLAGGVGNVHPGHLDAAAADGDDYALELYSEVSPMLGLAIANAVTLLNPKRLILGGGVFSRTPVLQAHVLAAFEAAVNPPAREGLQITTAQLGDTGGLVGAALLASTI
ncbi:MAG: ROK family protein [Myxococcales bacterium]|nr:ROK family protein [Myxococcales bacterium]